MADEADDRSSYAKYPTFDGNKDKWPFYKTKMEASLLCTSTVPYRTVINDREILPLPLTKYKWATLFYEFQNSKAATVPYSSNQYKYDTVLYLYRTVACV